MRLKNTSQYPDAEVRALVTFAMRGANTTGVAVNVKNSKHAYRGMAYHAVPEISPLNLLKTVSRLVTIGIGPAERFPSNNLVKKWRYPTEPDENGAYRPYLVVTDMPYGGKRSPYIEVQNWREALVAVAAHEARHIYQMRNDKHLSEVDAEKFAAKRLAEYRATT